MNHVPVQTTSDVRLEDIERRAHDDRLDDLLGLQGQREAKKDAAERRKISEAIDQATSAGFPRVSRKWLERHLLNLGPQWAGVVACVVMGVLMFAGGITTRCILGQSPIGFVAVAGGILGAFGLIGGGSHWCGYLQGMTLLATDIGLARVPIPYGGKLRLAEAKEKGHFKYFYLINPVQIHRSDPAIVGTMQPLTISRCFLDERADRVPMFLIHAWDLKRDAKDIYV